MIRNIFLTIISLILFQNITLADTIKFVQVTDTHFKEKDEYRTQVLKETVEAINKEKGISFVVFTGDNIDSAKEAHLHGFVPIINKLDVPYYLVIGNHDVFRNSGLSKNRYLEIVRSHNCFYRFKKTNYVFKKEGFVFIVLDGAKEIIPGTTGYYKQDTLAWLDKQLKKYKKDEVIIFQHFPVVTLKEASSHSVYKKEKYLETIDKHNNVISVISGHLHTNIETMRNGVYHISTPSLLSDPPVYKIITVATTKEFSPMIYTELKQVELSEGDNK